ncbi:Uncharacterized protein Adt_09033 [Abeliophyllum distichum]|uniref:Gnk2-homologous domain-containing protein n=1 Tax=Abeliophyllum distichum TaxID=126358 RepID=A0ABD1UG27_9LAMI
MNGYLHALVLHLDSLSGNVTIHNGFYTATWGENSTLIYSLLQCRGTSLEMEMRCIQKSLPPPPPPPPVHEDPGVVSRGNKFMRKPASTAPSQPLIFQEGILDVGEMGKRHAFVQCRRDLNFSTCDKCLNNLLDYYILQYGDRRAWELKSFG